MRSAGLIALFLFTLGCSDPEGSPQGMNKLDDGTQVTDSTTIIERGSLISKNAFVALSSALKKRMEAEGPEGAVEFCSTRALPLTDSVAGFHNAHIRRTSLKWRNPLNTPDPLEKKILEDLQEKWDNSEELKPLWVEKGDSIRYFSPIILQPLCTKCHGDPESFSVGLRHTLEETYPDDRALGYSPGDLRGMWSITMKK